MKVLFLSQRVPFPPNRGDKITTGVTTDIYLAKAGDHLAADFGRFGRVELTFT